VTLGAAEFDPVDDGRGTEPEPEPEPEPEVGWAAGSEVLGASGPVVGSVPGVVDASVWLSLVNGNAQQA